MSEAIKAWGFALVRMGALLIGGVFVGLFIGHVAAGLVLVLALGLAWHLVNLFRLDYWLRARSARDPPDASGIWGNVITQVVRLHRRKRYHKQRLLDVFRELRRSTAAMPDGVVVLNSLSELVWFNRMAGRLLGLRRRADIGIRITNLIRDPLFVGYLERGDYAEALQLSLPTGPGLTLSIQVMPYGRDQRLVLVRDVTRQVQLESMRKDFVANASHELRSPLTVITGYLETLDQDDMLDPGLKGPVSEMRRQSERMNAILRDLLELSRLDARNAQVVGEPVDVPALASLLYKDVLARPSHPAIQLQLESTAQVRGDEGELHSVFANLIDNAAKYTPVDGRIVVRWWVDEAGDAHLSVTDSGIGIAAEHLPRLTERFYRVDAGRSRNTGGSGLGLAIVKHALEHHGAGLEIQSREGVGSTFTCHFPARRVLPGRPTAGHHSVTDSAQSAPS
jgi:two-component system, OmpR family, phosphate regulon sensor histidine kinase PhoR